AKAPPIRGNADQRIDSPACPIIVHPEWRHR
ncbi:hypothetical protein BN1708_019602, partial [Verticillium longisporum]